MRSANIFPLFSLLLQSFSIVSGSNLDAECLALHNGVNVKAFYERGTCYVFDYRTAASTPWTTLAVSCTHLPSAYTGGLAMWLPPTVMAAQASLNMWAMFGMFSSTVSLAEHNAAHSTGYQFWDSLRFGQSVDHGVPSWQSSTASNQLMTNLNVLSNTSMAPLVMHHGRECVFYHAQTRKIGSSVCDNFNVPTIKGFICEYVEPTKRMIQSMVGIGQRLPYTYIAEQHVMSTIDACLMALINCAACHSLAYSSTSYDCQLYIADDRLNVWPTTVVIDAEYMMWQLM